MQDKNSFLLYMSYNKSIQLMTKEDAGELFQAIMRYANGEEVGELPYPVQLVFAYIQDRMDYDDDKYEEAREMRAESGKKGGAPKGNQNARKKQSKQLKQPKQAKQPDTVTVTDTVTDTDTVADTGRVKGQPSPADTKKTAAEPPEPTCKTTEKDFVPPTVEDVRAYVREIGAGIDPEKFVTHYRQRDWRLGKGGRMMDWKRVVKSWAEHEGSPPPQKSDGVSKRMDDCCVLPAELEAEYMGLFNRFMDAPPPPADSTG